VQKGRESCINTFYELKACMWKHFIPPSFRIIKDQQSRIEDFIDIGDTFIQNLAKFSRLEKDFKNNLDLLLSEQREREKQKREREKLEKFRELDMQRVKEKLEKLRAEKKKREQEKYEKNEKKKRDKEEKEKKESLKKAKEENERKELEEREKIRQESELERKSQEVELKSISKDKREFVVRDLVYHLSLMPSIKTQFPEGVLPSLNSSHFFIKYFVLFLSKTFSSPSHSHILSSSKFCAKTHFDFKILLKNHLSQTVIHSFCEVGLIPNFSNFISPFSHIAQSILLHGHYDFIIILFDDYCRFMFYPGGTSNLVAVSLKGI